MPSNAMKKFETKMLIDVNRLVENHDQVSTSGPGRRGLGHITRSGVFMLCASWELYVEELAINIAEELVKRADDPKLLPLDARKALSRLVKDHEHELKPLDLAGAGWKEVYLDHVNVTVSKLNTPKSGPIDEMYENLFGWKNPSKKWRRGKKFINNFVNVRGDIAHQGSDASYVPISRLKNSYVTGICDTVADHDNAACDFINNNSIGGRPWKRRTKFK